MKRLALSTVLLAFPLLTGCGLLGGDLPDEPPPLEDMEERVDLLHEPDDEQERTRLAPGVFTGIYVDDAAMDIEEMDAGGGGVRVVRVIENSPGDAAGLRPDDLLETVSINAGKPESIAYASAWRALELKARPGDVLEITWDRAGLTKTTTLTCVARLRPAARVTTTRFREELKVGLVFRTATEVEARAAGLGPGGGAVVVGLARSSPWRDAGLRFGDLITKVQGRAVEHPRVILDTIRETRPGRKIGLEFVRDGRRETLVARVSERKGRVSTFNIPILFSHEKKRGHSDTSLLFGLLGYESTEAAWEFRILWFITLGGGDAEKLKEVER